MQIPNHPAKPLGLRRYVLFIGLLMVSWLLIPSPARSALFNSGSTGADGAFAPSTNMTLNSPPNGTFWLGSPGMNTYRAMHEVLKKLGITADNGLPHKSLSGHQNHFHADIRPPQRVALPENLTASHEVTPPSPAPTTPVLTISDAVVTELSQDFNFTEKMTMFIPDMPNVPDQYLHVVMAAATSKEITIGVCMPFSQVPNMKIDEELSLSVPASVIDYLWSYDEHFKSMPEEHRRRALTPLEFSAKVEVLQSPKHGALTSELYPGFVSPIYFYHAEPNYMGKDQAIFLVEMDKYKIKVIYNLYPVGGAPDSDEVIAKVCGKRGMIYKISSTSDQLSPWLDATDVSSMFSGNDGVTLNITSLPPGLLVQTITLDTNAAGYDWFIDYIPDINDEFLPTSNPYEWHRSP